MKKAKGLICHSVKLWWECVSTSFRLMLDHRYVTVASTFNWENVRGKWFPPGLWMGYFAWPIPRIFDLIYSERGCLNIQYTKNQECLFLPFSLEHAESMIFRIYFFLSWHFWVVKSVAGIGEIMWKEQGKIQGFNIFGWSRYFVGILFPWRKSYKTVWEMFSFPCFSSLLNWSWSLSQRW